MGLFKNLFKNRKEAEIQQPVFVPEKTDISKQEKISSPTEIILICNNCNGHYKVREGKYGIFAGCSNYPSCKSTLNLVDLVLQYIRTYGLNIYRWSKECYKCGNETQVYSYYLDYDLADLDELFSMGGPTVGLGDLDYVDEMLSKQIPSIQMRYSNTTKLKYMANTCEHCGALQGKNYVVDDPHEIIGELWHDRGMNKFLFQTIKFEDTTPLKNDIRRIYSQNKY